MYILMTLGALGKETFLPAFMDRLNIGCGRITPIFSYRITSRVETIRAVISHLVINTGGVEVHLVALHTEERLVLLKQIVGHCAVRIMADGAIFNYRLMLKDKGPPDTWCGR